MPKSIKLLDGNETNHSESYSTFDAKNNPDALNVADAIEHIGCGWFQVYFGLIVNIAWIADGMEIMVVSILGPVLICECNIDVYQEAMLTTVVFWGFLIGSPIYGCIADKFGRINAMMLSLLWTLVYGLLSAIATNLYWLFF